MDQVGASFMAHGNLPNYVFQCAIGYIELKILIMSKNIVTHFILF